MKDATGLGFAKTFVLPALLVFVVPVVAWLFFVHAQSRYDAEARAAVLDQIRADKSLSPEERDNAVTFFKTFPFSQLLKDPEFAATVDSGIRFQFGQFRWAIRIAAACVLSGIGVFLLAGVCVLASMHSPSVQYYSLSAGWHVLRIFGALQALAQGTLLVAMSYWVTALWFEIYIPKLIFVIGVLAAVAVWLVVKAIFTPVTNDFRLEGQVVSRESAGPLWNDLTALCAKVGTQPPDQIIAGIDDNFFVTEHPVTVGDKTLRGRTLYVSLSLLKQLNGAEAAAVMAHEMAHFSGQDTVYSRKISPLLIRYGNYLQALHGGVVTLPIFYFMLCFRGLYELSLSRLSRQREFRADRIATEATSPHDFAGAMLRIAAYSNYRGKVEQELFRQERALAVADIAKRIESGFPSYAVSFAADKDIGNLETAHPFDSHPPLAQRLEAIGAPLDPTTTATTLASEGDGRWYANIRDAEQMERSQWSDYEERFRKYHEEMLAFRFLPANAEELAAVVKYFPEVRFESRKGALVIDYEKLTHTPWPDAVYFREIANLTMNDNGQLQIARDGLKSRTLDTGAFRKEKQRVLDTIQHYYTRYLAAQDYQQHLTNDQQQSDEAN